MTNEDREELKKLSDIPVLENELMWTARIFSSDEENKSSDPQATDEKST